MTAYQKRIKERDKARVEVQRLRNLIYNHIYGRDTISAHESMYQIALDVKLEYDTEKHLWQGESENDKL